MTETAVTTVPPSPNFAGIVEARDVIRPAREFNDFTFAEAVGDDALRVRLRFVHNLNRTRTGVIFVISPMSKLAVLRQTVREHLPIARHHRGKLRPALRALPVRHERLHRRQLIILRVPLLHLFLHQNLQINHSAFLELDDSFLE